MRKYFKTPIIKVYDPMITWYRCGQSTFSSCHHVAGQRKAKMDKSYIGWNPQRIRIKADKTPKMRKYFKTPTIKVYDPMITWYRCGQSTFSSCHHVAGQRKAKMDKSTPQRIRIKADKTPQKWENILRLQQWRCTIPWSHDTGVDNQHSHQSCMRTEKSQDEHHRTKAPKHKNQSRQNPQKWDNILNLNNQGVRSHDHMIQVWTINILVMPSRGREKQKWENETPKGSESRRTKPTKMTPTIKVYDPMITWYRCGNQHSPITWPGEKQKSESRRTKNPQKWENILRLQQSRCTIPWSHDTGVDNQYSRHAITWPDREKQKWTKTP